MFTGILLIAFLAHLSTCKLEALSRQNITKGEKRIFDDILCEEIPVSRLSPNFLIPFSPPLKKGPVEIDPSPYGQREPQEQQLQPHEHSKIENEFHFEPEQSSEQQSEDIVSEETSSVPVIKEIDNEVTSDQKDSTSKDTENETSAEDAKMIESQGADVRGNDEVELQDNWMR